jgi:DNA-binding NarL/FixJ family response regulator
MRFGLEHHGFEVLAEATDADQAIAAALYHAPQLCLLDVGLPGGAVSAAQEICDQLPETKVAMLAASSEDDVLYAAVRAGADGFLLKRTAPDRMAVALKAMLAGEAAVPRALSGALIRRLRAAQAGSAQEPLSGTASPEPANGRSDVPLPSRVTGDAESAPSSTLQYVRRFLRHFRRRRRSGMPMSTAWISARSRMDEYRQLPRAR